MRYKIAAVSTAAFVAGYILKSIIVPSTHADIPSALENEIKKGSMKQGHITEVMQKPFYNQKAEVYNHNQEGPVPYRNLEAGLQPSQKADITMHIGAITEKNHRSTLLNERAIVGTSKRFAPIEHKTQQKEIAISEEKARETDSDGIVSMYKKIMEYLGGCGKKIIPDNPTKEIHTKIYETLSGSTN